MMNRHVEPQGVTSNPSLPALDNAGWRQPGPAAHRKGGCINNGLPLCNAAGCGILQQSLRRPNGSQTAPPLLSLLLLPSPLPSQALELILLILLLLKSQGCCLQACCPG